MSKILSEEQIKKRVAVYIQHFTEKCSPPHCTDCDEYAVLYDQGSGDDYCEKCLVKSLRLDTKELVSLTDKYLIKESK